MKDPELLKETERLKVEIAPKSADWVVDYLRKTKEELKPEVIGRAKKVIGLN